MITLVAWLCGLVFALGLGVSGMTRPEKVLAFLDIGGRWDPSLAFVMIGAIAVHAMLVRFILRRGAPLLCPTFALPTRRDIDVPLLAGAAIFGIGWGLAGLCPGPALTVLASGRLPAVAFVLAMLAGMSGARPLAAIAPTATPTARLTLAPRPCIGSCNGDETV
jgi:uncharacterized membrane protein YedE/YeeE